MMCERRAEIILARSRDLSLPSERRPTSDEIREASDCLGIGPHQLQEEPMPRMSRVVHSNS